MSLEDIVDDVIETDLLVIGGGIGGPFAALFASEGNAKVTLLEKAAVRRSGATGMGIGGWHQVLGSEITLEDIAKDIDEGGRKFIGAFNILPINKGLVNKNLTYIGYQDNWEAVHALEKWGFKMKWDDDQYRFSAPDNLRFHGRNLKRGIARALKKSPVTVLERTMAVDLLTRGRVVVGATAFNIRTGRFIVCKAKATVLATGTISRIFKPWHYMSPGRFKMLYHYHAGSGDGIAMASRAGAELVNMEVSGIGAGVTGCRLADKTHLSHPPVIAGTALNARGEKIEGRLDVDLQLRLAREGLGPCFADFTQYPDEWHEGKESYTEDSLPIHLKFIKERGWDSRKDIFEVAHYRAEHNSVIAGVALDEDGRTSVERLYASGDMTGGNAFMGAANAAVFGMRAGKHATANLSKMKQAAIDEKQVEESKARVFAPKSVRRGVEPLEVEVKIRDIVERYCGPERSEGGINQGLWRLRSVRDRFLPELMARDNHNLMSAQEVRNLFLLAEVYMLCARERKESGMRTFRLDHLEIANDPWNEAIIAKLENGEIKLSRKKLPELREEFRSKQNASIHRL